MRLIKAVGTFNREIWNEYGHTALTIFYTTNESPFAEQSQMNANTNNV